MSKSNLEKAISKAEAKVNEEATKAREEIARLSATLPGLRQHVADIKDGLGAADEVRSAWKRGEDVPAIDYLTAQAEDEKAKYQAQALGKRVEVLSKRLPAEHLLLAEHVAPVFGAFLPGVPVITTNAALGLWRSEVPAGSVAVVLVQSGDLTTDPFTGVMSGEVTAHYLRQGLHRPISVETLEGRARAARIALEVKGNEIGDLQAWESVAGVESGNAIDPEALVIDSLRMHVAGVADGLPLIRKVEVHSPVLEWVQHAMADTLLPADGAITSARLSVERNPDSEPGTAFRVRFGSSVVFAGKPESYESNEGEVRTLTVTHVLNVSGVPVNDFIAVLNEVAQGFVGGVSVGMGRLASAEVNLRHSALVGSAPIAVTMTYESRTK